MDSLNNILSQKNFDEPRESLIVKTYVHNEFNQEVGVTVRERDIIVIARSASLANALRFRTVPLRELLQTKKRLVFRIGNYKD